LSAQTYFGTDGIRGRVGVLPITADFVLKLGWAAGQVLAAKPASVLIGQDSRRSGAMLAAALGAGFMAGGWQVSHLGCMPTPAVAYLTRALGKKAGIVISASHNPYVDNGIKIFNEKGQKLPDALEREIEKLLACTMTTVDCEKIGTLLPLPNQCADYMRFCQQSFLGNLSRLNVVLDCAQGAMSHIAPKVLRKLGAKITALYAKPDGLNINHQCGATAPLALQKAVLARGADLGIAFDGDGDRVIFVDDKGVVVDGDELLFIIARGAKQQGRLKGGVVGTLMSNLGLEQALKALAISFVRTQVGDRYVMDGLLQRGWQLGGEASGHILCLDKTTTGDGLICALQVLHYLIQSQSPLSVFKKGMEKHTQILRNVKTSQGAKVLKSQAVQKAYAKGESLLKGQGRIVLRPSGTEPLVRVMVEGRALSLVNEVAKEIAQAVEQVTQQLSTHHSC